MFFLRKAGYVSYTNTPKEKNRTMPMENVLLSPTYTTKWPAWMPYLVHLAKARESMLPWLGSHWALARDTGDDNCKQEQSTWRSKVRPEEETQPHVNANSVIVELIEETINTTMNLGQATWLADLFQNLRVHIWGSQPSPSLKPRVSKRHYNGNGPEVLSPLGLRLYCPVGRQRTPKPNNLEQSRRKREYP